MARRSEQVLAIDLVRFGCAMLVLVMHYTALLPLSLSLPRDWMAWSWSGWVGVEIFFVVSGYVIAGSVAAGDARSFLRRRALRLVPAAWLCASLTAAVIVMTGWSSIGETIPQWVASVTFSPLTQQIDGCYWTLGIELSFYLLVAATLNPSAPQRSIERVGGALAVTSTIFWGWHGVGAMQSNRMIDLLLLSHGGLFAAGIALWGIRTDRLTNTRGAMLGVGLAAGIAEIMATSYDMAIGVAATNGPWLPLVEFGLAVGVIGAADYLQPALARLGMRRLAFMGLMTYPLYLSHLRIGEVVLAHLLASGVPGWAALTAVTATALALAAVIAAYAEPAIRRAITDWLTRRDPAPDRRPIASLPIG